MKLSKKVKLNFFVGKDQNLESPNSHILGTIVLKILKKYLYIKGMKVSRLENNDWKKKRFVLHII
ncbi:hypothetical protein DERF_009500 [Dermatophagoides farinae]|uniref:Uncharacterized protein n=1 Tax=Dermatophagoides farinae TaxID=6954 RepID=A0A922L430_DERFA|nr:hypothetical protein DERF_009500 [Dermatophagoides farinae]